MLKENLRPLSMRDSSMRAYPGGTARETRLPLESDRRQIRDTSDAGETIYRAQLSGDCSPCDASCHKSPERHSR